MSDIEFKITYVRISEDDIEEPCGVPTEPDGTVLLSSVHSMFPGTTGLKYKPPDSNCARGVRVSNGILYPPPEGWDDYQFICVYPKDNKRKGEDEGDNSSTKSKRIDMKKCTDLIVLGLPWKTTDAGLKNYFSQFGDVVMAQVKQDPVTSRSKGFGFIQFADFESQVMCLAQSHSIEGRHVDVRLPISRHDNDRQEVSRKIFVGHITEELTCEVLKDYFSSYGSVVDVFVPKPFRKFAFVTFSDSSAVQQLLRDTHTIMDIDVHVSTAVPKLEGTRDKKSGYRSTDFKDRSSYGDQRGVTYYNQQQPPMGGGWQQDSNFMPQDQPGFNRFNSGSKAGPHGGNQMMNTPGDMSQNTAALAALNMLNNPNVIAAIMNVANQSSYPNGGGGAPSQQYGKYQGNQSSRGQ